MFFDALSTGHMGMATVHSESAECVLDRLITLIKKDVKAQYYTEDFLKKLLSNSIDVIVFLDVIRLAVQQAHELKQMRSLFRHLTVLKFVPENKRTRFHICLRRQRKIVK